ncbi:transcriptional regulator with XRE-family HTH domain [Lachnospiraceae bacterium PF1-21]|uniref:Helix-turn-helix domain-containing protein n=1 Tax=Ohessyouella blattaphilus TaxID=2949333 RepID=A0ABT1EJZ9_9FIRM|nr:helix-turn-helix transcriptional regulator [Ohessyouella blattaphilus]MCP1111026.1 helix-turn-helix domain-containing protein [Ohessyouella blattaphilus]MCR8564420.1 helix-turn-helix domain-containing protein [Ohessyouella blattaphilus]MDL2250594.1 helix-turn-helix domain-containing protein [Lachnospiraceae bacterium OttesenSCG-928-J05]
MNKVLGDRIRDLRTSKGLTQEFVANSMGVSRQKYARIENGINDVTLDNLQKISTILDVTVSDITCVLEKRQAVSYRNASSKADSVNEVLEMIDIFYANKRAYMKVTNQE